jgi:hypothetical protein
MRGLEIQLRTRSRLLSTKEGHALSFGFTLGPIQFFVITNTPEENSGAEGPLVYVKVNLKADDSWQVFREHYSAESDKLPNKR